MVLEILVNTGSGNGLLLDGTKPLPEPMLTYNQSGPVAFIWWHYHHYYLLGSSSRQDKAEHWGWHWLAVQGDSRTLQGRWDTPMHPSRWHRNHWDIPGSRKGTNSLTTWCIFWLHYWLIDSHVINSFYKSSYGIMRTVSTLVQVMACCLTAPSPYLNQCWLTISKVQWHSPEDNFARDTSATNHWI